MFEQSINPLWVEGKTVKNTMYGYSGNPLQAYNSDTIPESCIFIVENKKGDISGWLINNKELDGKRETEHIREMIKDHKVFYLHQRKTNCYIQGQPIIPLLSLIYSFERQIALEKADALNIRLIHYEPIMTVMIGGKTIPIYDYRLDNILSDEIKVTSEFSNGMIIADDNTLTISYYRDALIEPLYFKTIYTPDFAHILKKLVATKGVHWHVNNGALVCSIQINGDQINVAFAEIIEMYISDMIDPKQLTDSIIKAHEWFRQNEIVIDHLTHNKRNNFPWALAPIPVWLNKILQDRDHIKPPYFFWIIRDIFTQRYRLMFGVYGLWVRKYFFDDLSLMNDDDIFSPMYHPKKSQKSGKDTPLLATIYQKFKDYIGGDNQHAETSYLSYWGVPERAFDSNNIYKAMLDESEGNYRPALEAWLEDGEGFEGMPLIKDLEKITLMSDGCSEV